MQETQLFLVQMQTLVAAIAFQVMAALGLGLVWLTAFLTPSQVGARDSAFSRVASLARALGLLWLIVLVTAWPALLERTGNVLGPMLLVLISLLLMTEAVIYRLARPAQALLARLAGVAVAMGYTLVLALVVLAESWLDAPSGAALIDGRFQVVHWQDMVTTDAFVRNMTATLLAGLVLGAAWLQSDVPIARTCLKSDVALGVRAAITALAMAALVGLLWLLSQTTPASTSFYTLLVEGSSDMSHGWVMRLTFVLWLLTMIGLLLSLTDTASATGLVARLQQLPLFTAPAFWGLVWWQSNGSGLQSKLAGLPATDLVSTQPVWVLSVGFVMVLLVVVVTLGSLSGLFGSRANLAKEVGA